MMSGPVYLLQRLGNLEWHNLMVVFRRSRNSHNPPILPECHTHFIISLLRAAQTTHCHTLRARSLDNANSSNQIKSNQASSSFPTVTVRHAHQSHHRNAVQSHETHPSETPCFQQTAPSLSIDLSTQNSPISPTPAREGSPPPTVTISRTRRERERGDRTIPETGHQ